MFGDLLTQQASQSSAGLKHLQFHRTLLAKSQLMVQWKKNDNMHNKKHH